jgi:hypothetical protein
LVLLASFNTDEGGQAGLSPILNPSDEGRCDGRIEAAAGSMRQAAGAVILARPDGWAKQTAGVLAILGDEP